MKYSILLIFFVCCGLPQQEPKTSWDPKKLPIDCFHNGVGEYWEDLYDYTAGRINKAIGNEVLGNCVEWKLRIFPDNLNGVILFELDNISSAGRAIIISRKNVIKSVKIIVNPKYNYEIHYPVILHELGHALGLLHDHLISAMSSRITPNENYFKDEDLELLKELYNGI